jgi:hypothetical protein
MLPFYERVSVSCAMWYCSTIVWGKKRRMPLSNFFYSCVKKALECWLAKQRKLSALYKKSTGAHCITDIAPVFSIPSHWGNRPYICRDEFQYTPPPLLTMICTGGWRGEIVNSVESTSRCTACIYIQPLARHPSLTCTSRDPSTFFETFPPPSPRRGAEQQIFQVFLNSFSSSPTLGKMSSKTCHPNVRFNFLAAFTVKADTIWNVKRRSVYAGRTTSILFEYYSEMELLVCDQRSFEFLFTAARTCYCTEQKIFTRPDDCATL